MRRFLSRLKAAAKAFIQTYKFGGIKKCHIAYLDGGNLLKGKTVLITGGGSGIGKSIAKAALMQQASVVIAGRDKTKLDRTIQEFKNQGYNCKSILLDITNIKEIKSKISELESLTSGGIDILINNAGLQPHEFFPRVSEKEWERIYDTNSKGTYFMCQEFANHWLQYIGDNKQHKIINISSQGGFVGATYPYRMSKWDIVGLTKGLGLALANKGIIVNSIAPGVIKTEMQERYYKQDDNIYSSENPLHRIAFPEEIAQLAVFMMSDMANFIVGQTIICDGGYTLK